MREGHTTIPVITIEPCRLQSGLWGYTQGDISRSYSADCFSLKATLRTPFTHGSTQYAAMSVTGDTLHTAEARCYPLYHESYAETVAHEFAASGLRDFYTSLPAKSKGRGCVLGLPVIFRQRPYTREEVIDLTRRMFAFGGLFATTAGTYQNFLHQRIDNADDPQIKRALLFELGTDGLPQTQAAMRGLFAGSTAPIQAEQLTLFDL